MTREQADKVKIICKGISKKFSYYYNKYHGEEFRVEIASYFHDDIRDEQQEKADIIKILNALTASGMRPKYRLEKKNYKFVDCYYIVFT